VRRCTSCHYEGADEGREVDVFERLDDGKIKMTVMGNAIVLQHCDTDKGK
jgi:hypothetical protein